VKPKRFRDEQIIDALRQAQAGTAVAEKYGKPGLIELQRVVAEGG